MSDNRGIRLFEWAATLAILAVVALAVFPLFFMQHPGTRRMSCIANLKQFGTIFNMYLGDWGDTYPYTSYPEGKAAVLGEDTARMPTSADTPFVNRKDETWIMKLEPYVKYNLIRDSGGTGRPQGIMRCTDLDKRWEVSLDANGAQDAASYGYNFLYLGLPSRPHAHKGGSSQKVGENPYSGFGFRAGGVQHSDIASPADTLLLVENATIWAFPPCKGDGKTPWPDSGNKFIRPRHDGKSNVLFCDGHVTSIETKYLVGKNNEPNFGNLRKKEKGIVSNNDLWDIKYPVSSIGDQVSRPSQEARRQMANHANE